MFGFHETVAMQALHYVDIPTLATIYREALPHLKSAFLRHNSLAMLPGIF